MQQALGIHSDQGITCKLMKTDWDVAGCTITNAVGKDKIDLG